MTDFNTYFNHKFFRIIFFLYNKILIRKKLFSYGNGHGKYFLPKLKKANKRSFILSGGAGDNISFDIDLAKLGYRIILVDPTPRAKTYFDLKKKNNKKKFTNIKYIEKALWNKNKKIDFYSPLRRGIISHSTIKLKKNQKKISVNAIRVLNLMKSKRIKNFNIIKLDIEGSEYDVIKDIFKCKILSDYLLIEFDFLKKSNLLLAFYKLIEILKLIKKNKYKLIFIDNLNFTFKKC